MNILSEYFCLFDSCSTNSSFRSVAVVVHGEEGVCSDGWLCGGQEAVDWQLLQLYVILLLLLLLLLH